MFMKRRVSIDSVQFASLEGLTLVEKNDTRVQWQTPGGDFIIVRFIPEPTRNPVPLSDIEGLREQYKEMAAQQGKAMIDVNVLQYSGIPCMEMISKTKMDPHGMVYAGSASLLLSDFSFNISYHSPERGYTGFRDAMVAQRFFDRYGNIPEEEFNKMFFDLSSNPEAAQRSRADDECYDAEFPEHPLSKCRDFLRDLPQLLQIAPEVRKAKIYRD
jgi:hypothetical protein